MDNATDAFWKTFERMQTERKALGDCLDDLRRSTMTARIATMYRYGMLDKTDLDSFSEELKHHIIQIVEGP